MRSIMKSFLRAHCYALAGAIVAGRDYLVAEDWPCIKSQVTSQRPRQPMGFVSG